MARQTVRRALAALLGTALALGLVSTVLRLRLDGSSYGLYLLRQASGRYLLSDDLLFGEESALVARLDARRLHQARYPAPSCDAQRPRLELEWNAAQGQGLVTNVWPDGKRQLSVFSRYQGDDGVPTRGLFLGGGAPYSDVGDGERLSEATGMGAYDGTTWHHVWCNANEGLAAASDPKRLIAPQAWRYLGSRVVRQSCDEVVLASSHEAEVDGVPLRLDRYALFRAGQPYFVLGIHIANAGDQVARFYYAYGDEPWVGRYGASAGDVGWLDDQQIEVEGAFDARRFHAAGMADLGNPAAGERGPFTNTANFIAWLGPLAPDGLYFSNAPGLMPTPGRPLASNERFLGLQWGVETLRPGASLSYFLAIGQAQLDAQTGRPRPPAVAFAPSDFGVAP